MQTLSADAGTPTSTSVNYLLIPAGISLPFTFIGAGVTSTATVSGNFSFSFDQDNTSVGAEDLKLTYESSSNVVASVRLTKSYEVPNATEVLGAYFLGVGLRAYNHTLTEAHLKWVYSVTYSGKTLKTISSLVSIALGADFSSISTHTEKHQYQSSGGASAWVNPNVA